MASTRTGVLTGVSYNREELRNTTAMYALIDDCLAGSIVVKQRRTKYLPSPQFLDGSDEAKHRYEAYLKRAVFYAVARRTLEGFIGELFSKETQITVPDSMKELIEDMTGEGVGAVQLGKLVARLVMSKGRAGLFVDYPETRGAVTAADLADGIKPIIKHYEPGKIINWQHKKVGTENKLCLVVLEEKYEKETDGFSSNFGKQWRVLRLTDANQYSVELYRDTSGTNTVDETGQPRPPVVPTDASGKPFDTIPFTFVGSESNTADVDYPPMFDLCDLNMAHYRNSADYEESVFVVGQPTVVITGLTTDWADRYFKDGVGLGSRAAVPLPTGADAKLLQAEEKAMQYEAMEQKERQMVALGARLVEQTDVQRTATEASMENASETSVLANVSDNVSVAFEWALGFAAKYMGVAETGIVYRVNKEFSISFATPQEREQAIAAWQADAISWTELRSVLRKGGLASIDDEKARNEIQTDMANGFAPIVPTGGALDENGNPVAPGDPNAVPGTTPKGGKKPAPKKPAGTQASE